MGKGDRKSKKGKRWRGSHGKTRPKKKSSGKDHKGKKNADQEKTA